MVTLKRRKKQLFSPCASLVVLPMIRNLNFELNSMKQLLKEIVKQITQNLLDKSMNSSRTERPSRLRRDESHSVRRHLPTREKQMFILHCILESTVRSIISIQSWWSDGSIPENINRSEHPTHGYRGSERNNREKIRSRSTRNRRDVSDIQFLLHPALGGFLEIVHRMLLRLITPHHPSRTLENHMSMFLGYVEDKDLLLESRATDVDLFPLWKDSDNDQQAQSDNATPIPFAQGLESVSFELESLTSTALLQINEQQAHIHGATRPMKKRQSVQPSNGNGERTKKEHQVMRRSTAVNDLQLFSRVPPMVRSMKSHLDPWLEIIIPWALFEPLRTITIVASARRIWLNWVANPARKSRRVLLVECILARWMKVIVNHWKKNKVEEIELSLVFFNSFFVLS